MKNAANLQILQERGWRMGLSNFLRKENGEWWGTGRWWKQALLWTLLLNSITAFMLFVLPTAAQATGQTLDISEAVATASQILLGLGPIAIALGVMVATQDEVIGEKESGTAAWVLSKPASRTAFFLGKLISNGIAVLVLMVALPFGVAWALIYARGGTISPGNLAAALGVLSLHTLFYLCLTLMVGVFSDKRSSVLAATLGVLFGGQLVGLVVEALARVTPVGLLNLMPGLMIEGPASLSAADWLPVAATALWCLLFIVLSLWRVERLEL